MREKSRTDHFTAHYNLLGEEVTVNDAKARRELGYQGVMSREAGLVLMTSSDPSILSVKATS